MNVRRIITGHAPDGKAVFLADESTPRSHDFEHVPGFATALVWGTAPLPSIEDGKKIRPREWCHGFLQSAGPISW